MNKLITILTACVCSLSAYAGMSNSIEYSQVNIVGSAVAGGWDYNATPMAKISHGVFSWTGALKAGEPFKFMNSTDGWHKHIVATTADELLNIGEIHPLDFHANWQLPDNLDKKFRVAQTGTYQLIVDLMSMSVTLKEVPAEVKYPEKYYVTGSALDDEVIELDKILNFEFKKSITCKPGNVILMDTPVKGENTRYFIPMFEDVDLTFGKGFNSTLYMSTDADARGWSVSSPGDYMIYISCSRHNYQARKFVPRKVLYLVGGCCELAWNYWDRSNCIFYPNPDNPEELVWEGELRIGWKGDTEPEKFKILTEQSWVADTYHPYVPDTYAENTGLIRTTDGDDTKWCIRKDGYYKITVNTKHETITTEYSPVQTNDSEQSNSTAGINSTNADDIRISINGNNVELLSTPETVDVTVCDISGSRIAHKENISTGIVARCLDNGIYIISVSGHTITRSYKIKI